MEKGLRVPDEFKKTSVWQRHRVRVAIKRLRIEVAKIPIIMTVCGKALKGFVKVWSVLQKADKRNDNPKIEPGYVVKKSHIENDGLVVDEVDLKEISVLLGRSSDEKRDRR